MRAVTGDLPADEQGWAFEVKWDGYRALVLVENGQVQAWSANGKEVTSRYPELTGLPAGVHARSALLDGELVAFDDEGRPRFSHVQRHDRPVTYVIFDVIALDGLDTTVLPYVERRRLLEAAVDPGSHWLVPAYQVGGGAALLEATATLGLEGVMAKRLDSPYRPGQRSPAWRKIKHRRRQELVIGGWTSGTGNRSATFGALLVGHHDGVWLQYAGAVGTGFDDRALVELTRALAARATAICPFVTPPPAVAGDPRWRAIAREGHWVRPELVCEVAFTEWTADGLLRHPSFLGLREDKDPARVVREDVAGARRTTREAGAEGEEVL
jgi:bifunctional non-homologous end joining protein LigD